MQHDAIDPNLFGWAGDLQSFILYLKIATYGKELSFDEFFYTGLYLNDDYYYMTEDNTAKVKNELLCDSTLMEICLTDLDKVYHDELREMGEKLVNRDFEEFDKYGLTEEMIQDDKSLRAKIKVMNQYLSENC